MSCLARTFYDSRNNCEHWRCRNRHAVGRKRMAEGQLRRYPKGFSGCLPGKAIS